MERVIFDPDLYIDWLQEGLREELLLARMFLRHMSAVVLLELRAGVYPSRYPFGRRAVHHVLPDAAVAYSLSRNVPSRRSRPGNPSASLGV
jgi:hypothetical protein